MKKSINLAVKLLIITMVAAFALAFTNSLTSPVILERQQAQLSEYLGVVLEGAESFEQIESEFSEDIVAVYEGVGAGYVVEVDEPGGYGGNIHFLIGFDNDMKLTGFKSISHAESAGFGSKMDDPEFNQGLVGVDASADIKASDSGSETEIVGISGATYSTQTIVAGINSARSAIEGVK